MMPMRLKFSIRARFRLLRGFRRRAGFPPLRRMLWHRRLAQACDRIVCKMLDEDRKRGTT